MNTPKFSAKLESIDQTITLFHAFDAEPLSRALQNCVGQNVIAVGSGGSHVAASYLACCLRALGLGRPIVQTPMEVVLDTSDLEGVDVWLFSASANNADIAATARAAQDRGCASIVLCTRNADGSVATWVRENGGSVYTVPVAELKDGYLATHSLVSTCVALLMASDLMSEDPLLCVDHLDEVEKRIAASVLSNSRVALQGKFSGLADGSTLIVIADPLLWPLSLLMETALWEASICPVQVTDMRNFAHGRHSWLHHHDEHTAILALTGQGSHASWQVIAEALPPATPIVVFDFALCGRKENLLALIDGLFWIEAMGTVVGVDPGKPGIGDYGRTIYKDTSLKEIAEVLPAPVRQKRLAAYQTGQVTQGPAALYASYLSKVDALCSTDIGAVVMDYDGTVVSTEKRLDPPHNNIIAELVRLHELGLSIGFASGRGGSLGEQLRQYFPEELISKVLVGYFNGGHLVSADVDIDLARPPLDPVIQEVADWLIREPNLLHKASLKPKEIQLSVSFDDLINPLLFNSQVLDCPAVREARVRILSSGHSFDIIPESSNKLRVITAFEQKEKGGRAVLSIGDSGTRQGNDYGLLTRDFGISVGGVCSSLDGCWSLFGSRITGPKALLKILRSMLPSSSGGIRLNRASLELDIVDKE